MLFKINIIDDEKNLNDLVRTYLEKEGYSVCSFYTYDEALLHKDDDVHLWLIDIMLDKASGFELFNEIKASKPKMPIIFMSARDQEFDRIIGLDRLLVVHLNDSKNVQGAHKDRHANLGLGEIGFDILNGIAHNERIKDVPKILETPYIDGKAPYKEEIDMLKNQEFRNIEV